MLYVIQNTNYKFEYLNTDKRYLNISNGDIADQVISNVSIKSDAKASIYLWMEIFGNIVHLRKREMVSNDVLEYTY